MGCGTLAADLRPAGQGGKTGGEIRKSCGNVDLLGTDGAALSAAHTGGRPLFNGQRFHAHAGNDRGLVAQIVVEGEESGDVQPGGAAVAAVAAGSAGNSVFQLLGDLQQEGSLFSSGGLFLPEGLQVILHLFKIGHAAEDHGDIGKALEKTEAPGRDGLLRPERFELCGICIVQRGQLAARTGSMTQTGMLWAARRSHLPLASCRVQSI